MATVSKKDLERLSGLYADRLTRNTRYRVEDMNELIGSDVWRDASDEHKRFLKSQIRDKAFKLLMDAGFPPDEGGERMKFADLAVSAFLILFPLAWLASSAYATWKEYHRHIEQIKTIDAMRRSDSATNTILARCLIAWVNQKSLILYRDEDGTLQVRAIDTAGREEINKLFEEYQDE